MSKHTASTPSTEPRSLTALADLLEKPDAHVLDALLASHPREELVAKGAQIASPRVLVDDRRIYSDAYDAWQACNAEQRGSLRGFSLELLSVAVAKAVELSVASDASQGQSSKASASQAEKLETAHTAFARGLSLRDQLARVLSNVVGGDAGRRAKIDARIGTAEGGDALARGLEGLVEEAHALMKSKAHAPLAKVNQLDDGYLAKVSAAAAAVRSTADASGPRPSHKKAQADLDLLDGINLVLLSSVVHAFESAHDLDPSIPRLIPIATRRVLGFHGGGKRTGGSGAATGAAAGGAGAVAGAAGVPAGGATPSAGH